MKKIFLALALIFSFATVEACDCLYPEEYQSIIEGQLHSYPYLKESNPPLIIAFSGVPGMGKTTIAKRLEKELHGIRISNDELRLQLQEHGLNLNEGAGNIPVSHFQHCSMLLYRTLAMKSPNHLLILDKSIDRTLPLIKCMATRSQSPLFLIRLELDREEVEKRIRADKENPESYLIHLDQWFAHYDGLENEEFSYRIDTSAPIEELLPPLLEAIQKYENS